MERPLKRSRVDDFLPEDGDDPRSLSRPISPPRKKPREEHAPSVLRSPWQLTWIRDLPETLNQDAVTLKDLLGDPLISECWEFNFLHDLHFLMDAFDPDTRHLVKVHVVHGFWKHEDLNRQALISEASEYSNVELHAAFMPEMFGTHHSKMMILFRHDGSAQVIIHTANMIPKDWTNLTNAVWKSPLLPLLKQAPTIEKTPDECPVGSGERFKVDILNYLRAYDRRKKLCFPLIESLVKHDFSAVRGALIASVPGRHGAHDTSETSWGWSALKRNLSQIPASEGTSEVVVQISSIATLGGKDDWLRKPLFDSLSKSSTDIVKKPKFKIVFPTADEIRQSLDGYSSGGSIHTKVQSQQQAKQLEYLRPIFNHWANDSVNGKAIPEDAKQQDGGRARAAPHIKTYIRYNDQNTIDWAMLTSANLSKQAWGEAERSATGEVRISSWEIGVLVWPGLLEEGSLMVPTFKQDLPNRDDWMSENSKERPLVGIRVPYDVPLQQYGASEIPWVASMSHAEPDKFGKVWGT